ncbi:ATP-dependent zinc metalloprotease FtsH [Desulfitobacterium sp. AusDCA]|uniref:ATP-dependent zinc metalloprotease FtsH n=1 Tax=Desulfitobacterium sp. AusDCA TaxID=3240383 RepID=UPI003DA6CEAF
MEKPNKKNKPKKPLIYFYGIGLILLMLLNAFVFPLLMKQPVTEVDYGTFLTQVESGAVSEVDIQSSQINFKAKDTSGKYVDYVTGLVNDPELVNRLHNKGVKFSQTIPKQNSPLMNFLLTWILPLVFFLAMGQLLTSQMSKRMGGINAMSFGKSKAKIYVQAQTGKTFKDVAGQDEAKEALMEIVDFLHNPAKYADIGANLPKGALLVGPPGTGKTLLAQSVAGEAKVPFFSISGSEFVEMFVGMGAAKVRDLFQQANEKAPCIVFIDEIDTIGKKRGNGNFGGNDEREQTLNQLLTEMDGFDGKKGVVILAATNRPESLDKALLRPGRFDRRIPVELPDLAGRMSILKVHAHNVKMENNIDFNAIARATSGASGADLANIINEGALRAVKNDRTRVNQNDLEESVEVVIAGYQRKGAVISQKEKEIIAYHEIGHALVAAKQTDSAPVHKITIIPRTSGALGYTMQVDEGEHVLMSKEEAFNKIATFTGGRSAEELIFNTFTSGASNDIEQATKIARSMVTRMGMSRNFDMMGLETLNNPYLGTDTSLACSADTAAKIDEEVLAIIKRAHEKAIGILKENTDKLHELARYLLEKETITGDEFMAILAR